MPDAPQDRLRASIPKLGTGSSLSVALSSYGHTTTALGFLPQTPRAGRSADQLPCIVLAVALDAPRFRAGDTLLTRRQSASYFQTRRIKRIGARAGLPTVHAHRLRHGCGYALANAGHDTRAMTERECETSSEQW
jgi:hypothetical protein